MLDLAGAIALLLWGVHMVQTGVQRAFGPDLRRLLGTALRRRLTAFASGLAATAIIQSSTATGLMVAGFCTAGLVDLVPALAAMLGANVGTTLIVQVFSFDVAAAAPALVVLGVITFRRGGSARARDLGRVAIGLGLMLIALGQLLSLIAPYEHAPGLRAAFAALNTQPFLALLLAAALTWAAHSSVAIVLLVMSFAAKGVVPPEIAIALVLGANLGTAINPVLEGVRGDDPAARRVTIGNLLNRAVGCVVVLALLGRIAPLLAGLEPDNARLVADFHTGFNLVVAALFLPALGPYAALLRKLVPAKIDPEDPSRPRYLDQAALEAPPIALAAASREALRMADALEAMLHDAAESVGSGDRQRIAGVRRLDDVLDKLNRAIRAYVTALDADALTEADHRRLSEILIFTSNLESAGDVLDRNLMGDVARRLKRGLPLPNAERAEAGRLLLRLAGTVRAAAAVFMTEDARAARQLVAEKEVFRELEATATSEHFARLRDHGAKGDHGTLQLDLLREMKRVNGHLVAAAAYPVLESQGELLRSRLRPPE
ncbi:MAG TPA: Na/Pi cotransporter family protein [Acetobacteraceae bacterium]|nr:Na/Pi cotransporter family protein [Acetobacteraceae bacterium]